MQRVLSKHTHRTLQTWRRLSSQRRVLKKGGWLTNKEACSVQSTEKAVQVYTYPWMVVARSPALSHHLYAHIRYLGSHLIWCDECGL